MFNFIIQVLSFSVLFVLLTSIFMHVVRRNSSLVSIYAVQSVAVVAMLIALGIKDQSSSLLIVGVITFLVKVVFAPIFFLKLINRKKLTVTATTYVSLPITLAIILGLIIFVKSSIFAPLVSLFPQYTNFFPFSLSAILISWLLVINRRGVFSQIIGILSFENGLVACGLLSGIEQTLTIELGVLFDILLWIVIASVLVTLVLRSFGSLNAAKMNALRD